MLNQTIEYRQSIMNPFGELGVELSPSELRETAYEILVGACRISGAGRPLTYVSNSSSKDMSMSSSLSIQRSPKTSSAASKIKKALGMTKKNKNSGDSSSSKDMSMSSSLSIQRSPKTSSAASKIKKALGMTKKNKNSGDSETKRLGSVGELMRVQMRISEQTDSRIRRCLLRVAAAQLGLRTESIVLPMELLQHFKSSDFISQQEYFAWQKRTMKILEVGLLVHPHLPLDKSRTEPQKLKQILCSSKEKPIEKVNHSELMQTLRNILSSLAFRSFDGSVSDKCHWADGIPFNLHLYQILLEACFDLNDETSLIEEVDDVLEVIEKTWAILGINQTLHNLCYMWVLIRRYITTGQIEEELLFAADHVMVEVEKDANATNDPTYLKILSSTLSLILDWAEKMLLKYHDNFYSGNSDVMRSVLSLSVSAAKLLEDISQENHKKRKEVDVARIRVDSYIRSSLCSAFYQEKEKIISSRKPSKNKQSQLPLLSILAQNTCDMALKEREIYSPVLKKWHPLATGVAVATLHACYAKELKQFASGISEYTSESIQILLAANKLEKDLVEMAVAGSVDSEDGGKEIIQELAPYEAEALIANLVKSWIQTRVDRIGEWVDRSLQQEDWNPQVNKGRVSPSAVEVLRIIDETLEAFLSLPIPLHPSLLHELMGGLDKCLQNFITKAKSGCGSRSTFIPTLPDLTRRTTGQKFRAFKRKVRLLMGPGKKSKVYNRNEEDSHTIPKLCLRINTLYTIRKELNVIEKRTMSNLKNCGFVDDENVADGRFGISMALCLEGIHEISEATAYKVVFNDLHHVYWDYLYMGGVSSSRIEPFREELEQNLELVYVTVHDRVRTCVITDIMRASFEGFLLVLLAGGPSRVFTLQEAGLIKEDFKSLSDLFWSNGDGLPEELIDKFSGTLKGILPLFQCDTENLIEQLKRASLDTYGVSAKSRVPLPPMTGHWSATDPNTILRVLCYRKDKIAAKFLKKTYGLPKKT